MKRKKDDLDRLTERLIKEDPSFTERMEKADRAWDIAFQIYNLRKGAGLTQEQLAELIGTKQSNIARIESADYTAHSLTTLDKIAKALKAKVDVKIVAA